MLHCKMSLSSFISRELSSRHGSTSHRNGRRERWMRLGEQEWENEPHRNLLIDQLHLLPRIYISNSSFLILLHQRFQNPCNSTRKLYRISLLAISYDVHYLKDPSISLHLLHHFIVHGLPLLHSLPEMVNPKQHLEGPH